MNMNLRDRYIQALNAGNGVRAIVAVVSFFMSVCVGCTFNILVGGINAYNAGWDVTKGEAIWFFIWHTPIVLITVLFHALMWWTVLSWLRRFNMVVPRDERDRIHSYDIIVTVLVGLITLAITLGWFVWVVAVIWKAS